MKNSKRLLALAVSAALAAPMAAYATNGMNMEGYGPIATGMGGASMAYDNGTAAMMNNPATLGLADEGNRLDIAVGFLNPTVTTDMDTPMGAMSWDSDGTSYMMPAVGWSKKSGDMSYGVGMFAQGGMGAEYASGTDMTASNWLTPGGFMSFGWMNSGVAPAPNVMPSLDGLEGAVANLQMLTGPTTLATTTAAGWSATSLTGLDERSEVGVGRLLFPFTKSVNEQLTVGGSIDYVWAGMDLQMIMPGMMMGDMMMNPNSSFGKISGSMADTMKGFMYDPTDPTKNFGIATFNYGYFDFSDDSDYTGEAKGAGFAGKLGMTFKANDKLTIGATYHSKTSMSDLKASGAKMSLNMAMLNTTGVASDVFGTSFALQSGDALALDMQVVGDIEVNDFQWPSTLGLGIAFQANDKLMIAADVKRIGWADVMQSFKMTFTTDNSAANDFSGMIPGMDMGGLVLVSEMNQDWDDQTVINLGAAYKVTDATTVRAGYNTSSNPVPDDTLNWLFPAVTESHITLGLGHAFTNMSSVDVSLTSVGEVTGGNDAMFTTSMSQLNYQLMYSMKF